MTDEPFEKYWITIFAAEKNGELEIGITKDLKRTVTEQKEHNRRLVYYEIANHIRGAMLREEQIKGWRRSWQARLVRNANPQWKDLFESIVE